VINEEDADFLNREEELFLFVCKWLDLTRTVSNDGLFDGLRQGMYLLYKKKLLHKVLKRRNYPPGRERRTLARGRVAGYLSHTSTIIARDANCQTRVN
jgi:hypothetical protein